MVSRDARRPRLPLRSPSLGAKLILFSTLLTVVAVCVAFFFLSIQIRRHTRTLLAGTLAHHERMILNLQQRSLEELLRTSTLMTDSPTLRASMETYESESSPASAARSDLLATIQTEANKVAAGLGRDLLVVTDQEGRVLAAFGRSAERPAVGDDLSLRGIVRRALDQNAPVGTRNFAVLDLGGAYFQVGCVPILLQGFVIGTLTLGDRIDEGFVRKLQQSFDSDFVVAINGLVVGSTLPRSLVADADLRALASLPPADRRASVVTRLGKEEFVAATLALGSYDPGHDVTLYLLHSLTRALGSSNRFLLLLLLACGSAAVLLAGVTAWWMSRSVLRPLESFVDFMTSVAKSGDHARRFPSSNTCIEVEALNEAYSRLMDSLQAHEERLRRSAKEDLDRLTRLQESEKLAALGRMLSGAAHEINNPLTGVVGNIELLLRDDRLDPNVRDRLERVRREGQRIVALVRNLLKVSHRDTGEKAWWTSTR